MSKANDTNMFGLFSPLGNTKTTQTFKRPGGYWKNISFFLHTHSCRYRCKSSEPNFQSGGWVSFSQSLMTTLHTCFHFESPLRMCTENWFLFKGNPPNRVVPIPKFSVFSRSPFLGYPINSWMAGKFLTVSQQACCLLVSFLATLAARLKQNNS